MKGRIVSIERVGRSHVVEIDSPSGDYCGQKSFADVGDQVDFSIRKPMDARTRYFYRLMFGRDPLSVKYKGCEGYDEAHQAFHIRIL